MNVLITGANGFLGQHAVQAFLRRGHRVRALVRPAARVDHLGWDDKVSIARHDLRTATNLVEAFEGIDALVHLAAATSGDEVAQFASSVVGTERLLNAMSRSSTRRIVLASTFSVYDFADMGRELNEQSPLEKHIYQRDAYAIAKFWQERITRRMADEHGWGLTVLRPGFIWGPGHTYLACLGQRVGRIHLAIAPRARLPLTYVENCADCFAAATISRRAVGETFNVVDSDDVRAWQYLGQYIRRQDRASLRIPVPYRLWLGATHCAQAVSRLLFGATGKLPSIFTPIKFRARFRPLRYSTQKLRDVLNWVPPLSFDQCLQRAYEPTAVPTRSEPAVSPEVVHA